MHAVLFVLLLVGFVALIAASLGELAREEPRPRIGLYLLGMIVAAVLMMGCIG